MYRKSVILITLFLTLISFGSSWADSKEIFSSLTIGPSSRTLFKSGNSDSQSQYVPNEVLVKFRAGVDENEKDTVRKSLRAEKVKTIKSIQVEYWRLPKDITVEDALEILLLNPTVERAEPNYLYKPHVVPNDPYFNSLWYLNNTGQFVNGTTGVPGADISASEAWNIETGRHDIIIAVIDSGVAFDHPDLGQNVWTNTGEIPGNGIDDDNNGYIDDVRGWDFVNDDNNPSDYSKDLYGDGHGTHVAGIIAGRGNNGIGITGVMWNAQIMPLQIYDLFEVSSFYEAIIQQINTILAIEYAVDNGAKIINCSFGGPLYSQFQYDAFNYANDHGVLVVAAAGNSQANNDTLPNYPASYNLPNIISVAATNELDILAAYSNYGLQSVHVGAPGGGTTANIFSTVPPVRQTLFFDDFEAGGSKWLTGGIYQSWSIGYDSFLESNAAMDSAGYYYNNENSDIRTAYPINATNCRGLHLQFEMAYVLENGYDFLYLEGSLDGINFVRLDQFTGLGFVPYNNWTSEWEAGNFYLRFHLVTNGSFNYTGVSIDDVRITGIPWQFSGNEYNYKTGTSMATPVVSGIAGLIWSHYPNLTHIEVKNAILASVDQLDSLSGKVVTGGRVNAYKALLSAAPQLPNLTPYQPPGWSDKIVVSNVTGTNTDPTVLYTTDTLYLDWAVANNGPVATSTTFEVQLYVDDMLKYTWPIDPPLNPNGYTSVQDQSIGSLSAGNHTIKIVVDPTGMVDESNEGDNEYTKTIMVQAVNYTLSLSKIGNGSVKVNGTLQEPPWSGQFVSGTEVQLEAVPDSGWGFSSWGGDLGGSTNPISISLNDNRTVTANFIKVDGPDLTGEWGIGGYLLPSQSCKSTRKGEKCTIKGTFTLSNIGNQDASYAYVYFYLSDNDTYDEGEDKLLKWVRIGKIKKGNSKPIKLNYNKFSVGDSASGKYIIVKIEGYSSETRLDNNNTVYGPIQ